MNSGKLLTGSQRYHYLSLSIEGPYAESDNDIEISPMVLPLENSRHLSFL